MSNRVFITLEGIDGVGKTTQAKKLREALIEEHHDVLHTCEPGGTAIGERIRGLLLDRTCAEMSQETEILLYTADRAQHVQEVIAPALEANRIVICERYVDSSVAYQGYGLGLDCDQIRALNSWATGGLQPTITLCLNLDPAIALRKTQGDRISQRTLAYYRRVSAGFHEIAQADPERFFLVPAVGTIGQVHDRILEIVQRRMLL